MEKKKSKNIEFVFFGTPDIAVTVLKELEKENLVPKLIVTSPDRRSGRGMKVTPPPVKVWAEKRKIKLLQPQKIDKELVSELEKKDWDVFVLAAYGKILPKEILEIPKRGVLNVHPSLLPKYRGPSPIESQILNDEDEIGVSIMLLDEKMDHGPLIAQTQVGFEEMPLASELEEILGTEGGKLLAYVLPDWVSGEIEATEQDHAQATFCHFIKKEDGLIDLQDDTRKNYLKFLAYDMWPRVYFFDEKGKRVIVTDAEYKGGEFVIKKVIPEGKKETDYTTTEQ